MTSNGENAEQNAIVETIRAQIEQLEPSKKQRILEAIALAALSAIPWVGGVLAVGATLKFDQAGQKQDDLRTQWLQEHHRKLETLRGTLSEVVGRIHSLGEEINDRLESEEYLALIRKTFRQWDEAETETKRQLLVQLITNAAGIRECSDDIVRLFLSWIEKYHESHFAVIREVHKNEGPTRYDIWVAVYGNNVPRDDSAEADLYKMLIHDLSLGHVIRQARPVDAQGRFKKKTSPPRRGGTGVLDLRTPSSTS